MAEQQIESNVEIEPAAFDVSVDGDYIGKIQFEDRNFVMFHPRDGAIFGATEMIEIGQKMKEIERD